LTYKLSAFAIAKQFSSCRG